MILVVLWMLLAVASAFNVGHGQNLGQNLGGDSFFSEWSLVTPLDLISRFLEHKDNEDNFWRR